jgi:hypothetical protein
MTLKINILISILFIKVIATTYAQSLHIGKLAEINSTAIDTAKNEVYVYFKDYYKTINLETFTIDSAALHFEPNLLLSDYQPEIINSNQYFIHKEGGLVYKLKNDTLKRIDNSFNHLMQSGSNIFTYNSKIYRFGGYGFWSSRNFFTFFDEDLKEWEVENPVNSKIFPDGTASGLHFLDKDDLYIFNGQVMNPNDLKIEMPNNEVWKYNFIKKTWKFLGKHKALSYDPLLMIPIKMGNNLLLFDTKALILIDFSKNKITSYKRGKYVFWLYTKIPSFYFNNRFYVFNEKNEDLYFRAAVIDDFIGEKISDKPLYTNNNSLKLLILMVMLLAVFAFGFKFLVKQVKKRNKILLLDNGLLFKNKFTEFDPKAMAIIKTLLLNGETNSNSILGIVEESQYSVAHNERIKVQKIEEINFKIKTLLGINTDVINSKKSKLDRRIRVYTIKRDLFF